MEYTDNVIKFPSKSTHPTQRVPLNEEEVISSVNLIKHNHINETLGAIVPQLFNNMEIAGFSLALDEDEDIDVNIKDGALIVESIRSLLCKLHGLEHPFQELSDQMFEHKDGALELVDTLEITLNTKGDSES